MSVPAPACVAALEEATRLHPKRSRLSDGILGDQSHQARKSDHNLGNAWDLTHDPGDGVDCNTLAERIVTRAKTGLEVRAKYVIWNRRIASAEHGWRWRPYTGSNPHTKHMHVSIYAHRRGDVSPWFERPTPIRTPAPKPPVSEEDDDMTPAQAKKLDEVHAMLTALVRPRRPDGKDHDPGHVDLGDVLTKVEDEQ